MSRVDNIVVLWVENDLSWISPFKSVGLVIPKMGRRTVPDRYW